MLAARKRRRSQNGMLLAGLAMCAYFLAVYQPLSRKAAALDQPLLEVWTELSEASAQFTGPNDPQLPRLDAALESVQNARQILGRSRENLAERIQLPPDLVNRIRGNFQLIEFQNERQLVTEQLWRLARQEKVQLDPNLAAGFPEYFADRRQPVLLWVQLRLLQDVLGAAISSGVALVQSVASPPVEVYTDPGRTDYRADIPLQIELVGNATSMMRFLETLPLRSEEIAERGLPPAAPGKPAYFIHRLFIRKESREKPEEIRMRAVIRSSLELSPG